MLPCFILVPPSTLNSPTLDRRHTLVFTVSKFLFRDQKACNSASTEAVILLTKLEQQNGWWISLFVLVVAPQLHIHIYEIAVTAEKTPQEHFKGNLSVNSSLTKTNMMRMSTVITLFSVTKYQKSPSSWKAVTNYHYSPLTSLAPDNGSRYV